MYIVKQSNNNKSLPMYLTYTHDGWVPRLDRTLAFAFATQDEANSVARLMHAFRSENIYGPLTYTVEIA